MLDLPETDWKKLRQLHVVALDRYCRRILDDLQKITTDDTQTNHQRYLATYKFIRESDKEVARIFNDLRRSNAFNHLVNMMVEKLLTDEEFATLTQETRDKIANYLRE